jgi:pimeloyl-ACP methyl ester carboxylesterase
MGTVAVTVRSMQEMLNGIEVYFERRGRGPRLLLCNGSSSSIATSEPLIDVFASRFEVLVHDQRGLGRTEVPPMPGSMADYAADAAALLDCVGWPTCLVVGISFGGMVAQEFATTWPERVERLALLCTSPGGPGGSSYPLHELAELQPEKQIEVGLRVLDRRFTPGWLATHPKDQGLVEMMAGRRARPKTETRQRGEAGQLEARRDHDVWDRLDRITCPTLVAGGRFDGIAPPANSEAIASRVPNAQLRIYDGGHAFFAQDGHALPDILGFLADDVT